MIPLTKSLPQPSKLRTISSNVFALRMSFFVVSCAILFAANAEAQTKQAWTRPGVDWPRFLGTEINGISKEMGIRKDWTQGKLKIRWQLATGEGYGMGSVADGRFFHFGKYDDEAILKCCVAETGKLLWQFRYLSDYTDMYGYDSGPRASPIVDGDRVYIFGVEGMLHCLNVGTGKVIWKVDTAQKFGVVQNFFGVGSSPVIFEDKLLVMIGGSPAESQKLAPGDLGNVKSNGSGIVAFDKLTGKTEYQAIDDLASYSSLNLMQLGSDKKTIGLAWMRNELHGFDPNDGKQIFRFPWRARKLESVNAATPTILGQNVLLTESYRPGGVLLDLSAIDPTKTDQEPKVVWSDQGKRKQAIATHWNTPVVSGNYVYACSGQHSNSAELRCVNWKTGEVQWSKPGFGRASLTRIDGHLIVISEFGDLLLLKDDPAKFNLVTKYEPSKEDNLRFRTPCWAAPIVSHGLLWVRGKDKLVCFDILDPTP